VKTKHIECEYCGLRYRDFRTEHTYKSVRDMLWVASDNPEHWVYKRRGSVLRLWHKLKMELWDEHVRYCELQADQADDRPPEVDCDEFFEY